MLRGHETWPGLGLGSQLPSLGSKSRFPHSHHSPWGGGTFVQGPNKTNKGPKVCTLGAPMTS